MSIPSGVPRCLPADSQYRRKPKLYQSINYWLASTVSSHKASDCILEDASERFECSCCSLASRRYAPDVPLRSFAESLGERILHTKIQP